MLPDQEDHASLLLSISPTCRSVRESLHCVPFEFDLNLTASAVDTTLLIS